jgi:cytochrome P450
MRVPPTLHRLPLTGLRRDPIATLAPLHCDGAGGSVVHALAGRQRLALLRDPAPIEDLLVRHHDAFGKVNEIRAESGRVHPFEPRGALLFSDRRDEHLATRRAIGPAFAGEALAAAGDVVAALASALVAAWPAAGDVDASATASALAVEATMRTVFCGARADGHALAGDVEALLDGSALFPAPSADPPSRELVATLERVGGAFSRVLAEAEPDAGDVPARMREVAARLGVDDDVAAMTLVGVFAAGVETTVHALAYALALVADRPEVAAWLAEEADAVAGGRPLCGADLERLPRCRAAFAETLRLYPPSWFIARHAGEDVDLAGEPIAAGTIVLVLPPLLHRDPRFFADPGSFRPERWLDGPAPPRHAYIPFGAGRRKCLGERIAWAEGTALIAAAVGRFTLSPAGPVPEPVAGAALAPSSPVRIRLAARTS